jgi:dihydroorotate dehydrogenase
MAVGANAVGIGTASFADPRAVVHVFDDMCAWAERRGMSSLRSLTDRAHLA